jgi:lipopolysaccharide biosynthesis regulator YciM
MRWRGLLNRARGRPGAPRDADEAIRASLLCVLDHDLDGAAALLQEVVGEDSRQVEAYLALARVFRLRGELGRAIRLHQNLLLRSDLPTPQRRLALRGLADDFRAGGFVERACEAYEQLLAETPRDALTLRALVRLHREAGRPERALELARRLPRKEGAGAEARREEAALAVEVAERARVEGRADVARRALRRALRRDPRSAAAYALLGELEVERGRSKRALAAWRKALALDHRRSAALLGKLRSAFASLGRAADYEAFLRELAGAEPGEPEPRLALAQLLRERGEAAAAASDLRALLSQVPGHLEAQAELGRCLAAAGRADEACAVWAAFGDTLARSGALLPVERGVE